MGEHGALTLQGGFLQVVDTEQGSQRTEIHDPYGEPSPVGEFEIPRYVHLMPWCTAAFVV